jgi:hypothetical protein
VKRIYLSHDRRTDRRNVCIEFPYDEQLIEIIRQIPGRTWVPKERVWRCPPRSLPQIINALEPEGFQFSEALRQKVKEIEEKQVKQAQKWEQERLAEEQLHMKIAAGEEAAFIPSSNASLTRKLKKFGAYEIISEENDYGQQVAGLKVLEKDLLATLSEMGEPTEPVSRLLVMLNYAWLVNADAKEKRYLSSQYRYM